MKLTWTEVVKESNMKKPATASFYRDRFIIFFSFINEGRNRRYHSSCIETLNFIHKLYSAGNSYEFVLDSLENNYGVPTDIIPIDNNSPSTQQADFLEAIREVFSAELSKRDSLISELQSELTDIKESLLLSNQRAENGLRESENRDADIMSMMRLQQLNRSRKWWHIFKK